MFALPFVFSRAGFWVGAIELVLLTCVTIMMNLLYGEIVLRTPSRHLLPGFVGLYLGKRWFYLESASAFVGFVGGLFVYILLGGTFLANLLSVAPEIGQLLFFLAGAVVVLFNLKTETKVNYILTLLLVFFILFLSAFALKHFSVTHLSGVDAKNIIFPYGVILFALSGGAVIPEIAVFLGEEKQKLRSVLAWGVIIPALIYFIFTLSVVAATGIETTSEALGGLAPLIGRPLFFFGNIIGFLATFTSFIMFAFVLEDIFRSDFRFRKASAWIITVGAPAFLFLLPFRNFVTIMNFLGAIAIGIDSLFILWLYGRVQRAGGRTPEYALHMPRWGIIIGGVLFFAGLAAPFI